MDLNSSSALKDGQSGDFDVLGVLRAGLQMESSSMPGKTDSEVEQWVLRELSVSTKIRSPEICVLARDGVITLRGSAQSYHDKLAIENATRRACGVVGVVNEMRVAPGTALTERVLTSVALTGSPGRGILVQPAAIQRSVAKA